jgi:UDP:flavonoid glycosyltransferase YjiC (YdhE family)
MHALLISDGSLGDTLPFLEWGRALAARGHRVTLLVNGYYGRLFDEAGLDYVALTTAEEHAHFLATHTSWKDPAPISALPQMAPRWNRPVYEFVAERYVPDETVVAAQATFVGARIAQEQLGVPLATVHLQPMWLGSTYDSPAIPSWCPRLVPILIDRVIDVFFDRLVGRPTNRFRAELGLPPVKRAKRWWNSPQLVLGMWPDWYNPPQPDWPPNTQAIGWLPGSMPNPVFNDEGLERFLSNGEPPIVFLLSSYTQHARHFFEIAVEAAARLGRRSVLLAPHQDQLPAKLPPTVCSFPFIPLDKLLPRAAAHVHHGGSGTVAHTLAAGIPHVTVPQTVDQVDIGQRLLRLGVSKVVHPSKYTADTLTSALRALLDSPQIAERCRHYAARCLEADTVQIACDALERLWSTTRSRREASIRPGQQRQAAGLV